MAPWVTLAKSDNIDRCKDSEGKFVPRNHIFRKGAGRKLRVYAEARKNEISQGGESTPSIYPFAINTSEIFCDTAIFLFEKGSLGLEVIHFWLGRELPGTVLS